MKKAIYFIIFLLLLTLSYADNCQDTQQPNIPCQMITPTLSCSVYFYDIINSNGTIIVNASLINLNTSIYYLNFNQSLGDYIIRLCDNSTREIYVQSQEDGKMDFLNAIIILPLLIGALLLFAAGSLSEEHKLIKAFIFLLVILMPVISFQYSISITNHQDMTFIDMIETMGLHAGIFTWVYVIIFIYFVLYFAVTLINTLADEKKRKLEY